MSMNRSIKFFVVLIALALQSCTPPAESLTEIPTLSSVLATETLTPAVAKPIESTLTPVVASPISTLGSSICPIAIAFPPWPNVNISSENVTQIKMLGSAQFSAETPVLDSSFSPDGIFLITLLPNDWCLYRYSTGQLEQSAHWELPFNRGVKNFSEGHLLAVSPDGTLLATTSNDWYDCVVRVWQMATGSLHSTLVVPTSECENTATSLAFSPDGQLLAAGTIGVSIRVWQVKDGKEIYTLTDENMGSINDVVFSHDGQLLATVSMDGFIHLWEAATGKKLSKFGGVLLPSPPFLNTTPPMAGEAVNSIQQRLAELGYSEVGSIDGTFGPKTESAVKAFQHDQKIDEDGIVGEITWNRLFDGTGVSTAIFSPDDQFLISGTHDGKIQVWGTEKNDLIKTLSGDPDSIQRLTFSPDGTLLVSSSDMGSMSVWLMPEVNLIHQIQLESSFRNFNIAWDGAVWLTSHRDGRLLLWGVAQ